MKYQAIIRQVMATPWMIHPAKLSEITTFLASKAAGQEIPEEEIQEVTMAARKSSTRKVAKTQVIPILGTIINRETSLTKMSGLASVQSIRKQLNAAMADGEVGSILLDIDSPGGTAEGIADLAADIRQAKNEKPIYASVDGLGASAAYYLASQATRLSVTKTSEVGSIGVILAHQDMSEKLAQEGVNITLISAGKYKAEGNPFQPLSEEAQEEFQGMVDYYYDLFLTDVAKGRQVPKATVKKDWGQGRLIRPPQALKLGMVDAIETTEQTAAKAIVAGARKAQAVSIETVRDFEAFLRDSGFSKSEATKVAASGFSGLGDPGQADDQWAALMELARKRLLAID